MAGIVRGTAAYVTRETVRSGACGCEACVSGARETTGSSGAAGTAAIKGLNPVCETRVGSSPSSATCTGVIVGREAPEEEDQCDVVNEKDCKNDEDDLHGAARGGHAHRDRLDGDGNGEVGEEGLEHLPTEKRKEAREEDEGSGYVIVVVVDGKEVEPAEGFGASGFCPIFLLCGNSSCDCFQTICCQPITRTAPVSDGSLASCV